MGYISLVISLLAIHTTAFEHVFVMLVAGLALCNEGVINKPISIVYGSVSEWALGATTEHGTGHLVLVFQESIYNKYGCFMNTASKLRPHTQTGRGTCPGVGL